MRLWRAVVAAISMLPILCHAQGAGVAFQSNAVTTVSINGTTVLRPVAGANVYACAATFSSCSANNQTPIFSDINLTAPISQPLVADKYGNFTFYALPGQFKYTIYSGAGSPVATYPFTVVSNGAGSITPQSINAILYADAFPGSDLAVKIANAFASVAGTAPSPSSGASIKCSPGKVYTVTSGPIQVPRSDFFPFIRSPIIDCQNSIIVDGRANSSSPLINVGPTNALSVAVGSGMLTNATLVKDNTSGPIMQMTDRLGFLVRNVDFVGGLDSIRQTSVGATTSSGGPIDYPYLEQNHFENVAIRGCGRYGVNMDTQTGGTGSHLHQFFDVKFDLQSPCSTAVYVGSGSDASDNELSLHFNTGNDAVYHALTVDGQYNSGNMRISGEPTGNPGAILYAADGASYSHPVLFSTFRGNVSAGPNSQPTLASGCVTDEGFFLGRHGQVCLSSNLDLWLAKNGDAENNSHTQAKACPTFGSGSKVGDSLTCLNVMWLDSFSRALFGACWFDSQTPCVLPGSQYGAPGIAAHGIAVVAPTPATGARFEYGVKGNTTGNITEYIDGAVVFDAARTGGPSGTTFTGTCAPGTSIHTYINGRAIGPCS